jgi:alpha-tubulin suppressor-like RCC1 family protein
MVCWGHNGLGQLASGNTYGQTFPNTISLGNVMGMSTGHQHACAVLADRTVYCWGSNAFYQLGDLSESYYTSLATGPVQITINDIVAITSGFGHTCALRINGTVACWGQGSNGQLGNGGAANSKIPVAVVSGP